MPIDVNHFHIVEKYINRDTVKALFDQEESVAEIARAKGIPEEDIKVLKRLLHLSTLVSECLHEDWKNGIIAGNGKEYQHWRKFNRGDSKKDPDTEREILARAKEYAKIVSVDEIEKPDGTKEKKEFHLYRFFDEKGDIIPPEKVGDITPARFEIDLTRVAFPDLSEGWQNANLDAAKFAIALISVGLDKGALQSDDSKQVADDLDDMAHDIHIEWMLRERGWGNLRLFLPYELLTVEEQGKDKAQIMTVLNGLTFSKDRANVLDRNRQIVIRAVKEVLAEYSDDNGLKAQILKNIELAQKEIDKKNSAIEERCQRFKDEVKKIVVPMLQGKDKLTLDDLESVSAVYFKKWKEQAGTVVELPEAYRQTLEGFKGNPQNYAEVARFEYDHFEIDDARLNFKNIARYEIADLIKELASEGLVPAGLFESASEVSKEKSAINSAFMAKNEEELKKIKEAKANEEPGTPQGPQ